MTRRRCPVCHRMVSPTRWGRVALHRDSIGRDVCPMSCESFELCEHDPLMNVAVAGSIVMYDRIAKAQL